MRACLRLEQERECCAWSHDCRFLDGVAARNPIALQSIRLLIARIGYREANCGAERLLVVERVPYRFRAVKQVQVIVHRESIELRENTRHR